MAKRVSDIEKQIKDLDIANKIYKKFLNELAKRASLTFEDIDITEFPKWLLKQYSKIERRIAQLKSKDK